MKDRFFTSLILTGLIILILVSIVCVELVRNREEYLFTFKNKELVSALREDMASKEAELKKSYLKKETAQDKLINAVAEELGSKK